MIAKGGAGQAVTTNDDWDDVIVEEINVERNPKFDEDENGKMHFAMKDGKDIIKS